VNGEDIESETIRSQPGTDGGSRWNARTFTTQHGQTAECERRDDERRQYHQRTTDSSVLGSVTGKGQGHGQGQITPGWNRRRIQYLKNYVAKVAPWVFLTLRSDGSTFLLLWILIHKQTFS
jgi:hypothetical protein